MVAADLLQYGPQLASKLPVRFHVGRRIGDADAFFSNSYPVLGKRQILAGQPEIQRMSRHLLEDKIGKQAVGFNMKNRRIGLPEHLDVAQREFGILVAPVEVVQSERLLKLRGVRLRR